MTLKNTHLEISKFVTTIVRLHFSGPKVLSNNFTSSAATGPATGHAAGLCIQL